MQNASSFPKSSTSSAPAEGETVPLCVDLDGTLLRTDTLYAQFFHLLRVQPGRTLSALSQLKAGRSHFKDALSSLGLPNVEKLPRNEEFVAWLRAERATGREIHLVTAAHTSIAAKIADDFGIFTSVMASSRELNLDGKRKGEALVSRFGKHRFDYAGNSRADLHVWVYARHAIVVNAPARVASKARQIARVVQEFP